MASKENLFEKEGNKEKRQNAKEKRPKYENEEGPLKIMTFGKFGTYKKVEGLIEAVEMVREQTGRELEIVIAGTGPKLSANVATIAAPVGVVSSASMVL